MTERLSRRALDADTLERSLGGAPGPARCPALVVMAGLPGSGKSYLARQIADRHTLTILNSDALRAVLFESPRHSVAEHRRLFPAIHELIGRMLSRNVSVLVDATNLKESNRKPYYRLAKRYGTRLILVRTWATAKIIRERLLRREAGADRDDRSTATLAVYEEMRQDFEQIRRRHVSVNTSLPLEAALDKIVRLLEAN